MAKIEREYNVPLRREFNKVPKYRRTNKAVKALREFIAKHMKSDNIKLGKFLNLKMWERGIKNPPHKVTVTAVKQDDGTVNVELKELPTQREKVNKRLARTEKATAKRIEDEAKKAAAETKKKADAKKDAEKKEVKSDKKETTAKKEETKKE